MNILTHTISFSDDPMSLLDIFKDEPHVFFLDSSLSDTCDGRFSYFGFAPFETIKAQNFGQLRKALKPYQGLKSPLSFPAGAVGYISYDGALWFGLYEGLLCVDHHKQTLTITSTGLPYRNLQRQKQAARQKIDYILYKLQNRREGLGRLKPLHQKLVIKSNTTLGQYVASVKRVLKHIHDGDIYQINLSHRLEAAIRNWRQYVHPAGVYQHLRRLSPSPLSAYLDDGQTVILSSSPERFLKLRDGVAQVRPMKGTRPRGKAPREDQRNRQELMDSAKEKAELLMVTDLERNDLGRVCGYGSVRVKAMRTIEEYTTVFQATSTVEGLLRKDCDQFDLLESTFPSGSVTGCPKIEAMKIIRRLEKAPRGLYTGALGYISFGGDMDFNVLIRTLFLEKDKIFFYVGSGIVADSNPQDEYEETLIKAEAMIKALKMSL
ncbi:MAG: anthranilate synthase component I family protein [Candidatus Omnitrophica bacterium]|nr:anthranilate synthase component I family protein [Candidatus Omnitrophota bacterium]